MPCVAVSLILMLAAPLAPNPIQTASPSEGVKDRDGTKVQELISSPGSIVIIQGRSAGDGALHILTRDRDLVGSTICSAAAPARPPNNQGETRSRSRRRWDGSRRPGPAQPAAERRPCQQQGRDALDQGGAQARRAMVRLLLSKGASPTRTDSAAAIRRSIMRAAHARGADPAAARSQARAHETGFRPTR